LETKNVKRSAGYNTKQSQAILAYIASLDGGQVTVAQVAEHFESVGSPIGLTTVYRHLDKLVRSGRVRRYIMEGAAGSCHQYEYIDEYVGGGEIRARVGEESAEHFHLKCEDCGALLHMRCEVLSGIPKHVYEKHSFRIDASKTVFYGKCSECLDKDVASAP
jgi:Fur family ferric uptake transcriptional regulator